MLFVYWRYDDDDDDISVLEYLRFVDLNISTVLSC